MPIKNPSFFDFCREYYYNLFGGNIGVILILTVSMLYFLVMLGMLTFIYFKNKKLSLIFKTDKSLVVRNQYNEFQEDKTKVIKLFTQTAPLACLSIGFLLCTTLNFFLAQLDEKTVGPSVFLENLQISQNEQCNEAVEYLYQASRANHYISTYIYHNYVEKNSHCYESAINRISSTGQKSLSPEAKKWMDETIVELKNAIPKEQPSKSDPNVTPFG